LTSFGVTGVLSDPYIELHDSTGALMTANDSWQYLYGPLDELTEPGNRQSAPTNPLESLLWPILKSSAYTTILKGASGQTGIGLVEFFEY
jgi:hypothetical protein